MTIVRVEATALTVSFADMFGGIEKVPASVLRPAAHFQTFPRSGQYSTLVTIEADDGTVGYGEAWGLPLPEIPAAVVNRMIAPLLIGRAIDAAPGVLEDLTLYFGRLGLTRGGPMEAISGVDIALWDLRAKREGKPVSALIGTPIRDAVECYASPIMFKDTPDESAAAASAFAQAGFSAVKLKVGRGVDVDIAHIAAVRDVLGLDAALMVDANGAYDAETAIELARAIEPYAIAWLEEPVSAGRVRDLARVRQATGVRIACGENDFSLADFGLLLEVGGVDVVMPNVTRAGGISGVLKIAGLAQQAGAEVSLHGVGSGLMQCASLHVMSVTPNARYFEVNTFPNPLRERLVLPPPRQVDGRMYVPSRVGLGCAVDQGTVAGFKAA